MFELWWIVVQTLAQTGLSILITYVTWLIVRGQRSSPSSENEEYDA